jgi:hypothetical protein
MWIPVTWQYEYGDHTAVVLEIDGKRDLHLTATVMVIYVLSMHLVRFCRLPLVVCQEKFFGDCLILQRIPMEFWTHWIILILWWRYSVVTAEEKSLDLIFGVVCVTAQPSSTGSRKCEKDNEERSIVTIWAVIRTAGFCVLYCTQLLERMLQSGVLRVVQKGAFQHLKLNHDSSRYGRGWTNTTGSSLSPNCKLNLSDDRFKAKHVSHIMQALW